MTKIEQVQKHLAQENIDGWLLYDFHRNNSLAHTFLEISPDEPATRRFFYWIPRKGSPIKLVHAIESRILDRWPGEKRTFSSWQSLEEGLKNILHGQKKVAMEYSPKNAIPYLSKVDAGTVDLIRSFGVEVVSSAGFLPYFTAVLTEAQGQGQMRAGRLLEKIVGDAWIWIEKHLQDEMKVSEYDVQQKILADFAAAGLVTDMPPIVALNEHSADPHYTPHKTSSSQIRPNDWILIDLWAKEKHQGSVFADITRVGFAGLHPTAKQQEIFHIVREAQVVATELVKNRFASKKQLRGWEVDDAARNVIKEAGYGEFFTHRTGHSIEMDVHGSGAHMDNLEMHDERLVIPNTSFSVEPGIYLSGSFGVRLEYDLYIHQNGTVDIVGGEQDAIVTLRV